MVDTAPVVRSGALLAVVVTVLAWASAFVAIRAVGASYGPGPLALGRLLVGALALGAAVLVSRRWVTPTGREWALIVLCGWRGSASTTWRSTLPSSASTPAPPPCSSTSGRS